MDKRIEIIDDFIKRNYRQKLSLDMLAEKAKLSPYYFQRLFKKEMNESPSAYLNRVRLEKAAHMLKAGFNDSISDIADECGFSSAAVFNRSFRQFYNMSPLSFLKSPEKQLSHNLKTIDTENFQVEVIYLPDIYIYGIATSINNNKMAEVIEDADRFCKKNNIDVTGRIIGVLTHYTLHHPTANGNYYLGTSVLSPTAVKYSDRLFLLSKGKYACFQTTESVREVRDIFMRFKNGWLEGSRYTLTELIAFEEFLPGVKNTDYPNFQRKVYIPVQLK